MISKEYQRFEIYWTTVVILVAIQFVISLLFVPRLVNNLGTLGVLLPIVVGALLVGVILKHRIMYLLTFIWSILILIHSIILLIINYNHWFIVYLAFAILQVYIVSQTEFSDKKMLK